MSRYDPSRPVETRLVTYRDQAAFRRAEPGMVAAGWRVRGRYEREFRPFGWLMDATRSDRTDLTPPPVDREIHVATPYGVVSPRHDAAAIAGCVWSLVEIVLLPVWAIGAALNAIARRIWGRTRIEILWERDRL